MNRMTGIIYKATNLANGKVYIGQTKKGLETRKKQHLRDAEKSKRNKTYFHHAINKYGESGFHWEVIDRADTPEELSEKEEDWIIYYGSLGEHGYNLTPGGHSASQNGKAVYTFSLEGELLSEHESIASASEYYGIPSTSIGFVAKGKRIVTHEKIFLYRDEFEHLADMFVEVRERVKRHNPERFHKRGIVAVSVDGVVMEFDSIYEASKFTGIERMCISRNCKDKKAYKRKWAFRFAEDTPNDDEEFDEFITQIVKSIKSKYRPILMYTTNGKYLNTFDYMSQIKKELGYPTSGISMCCSGKRKVAYGHIFLYADEYDNESDILKEIERRIKSA